MFSINRVALKTKKFISWENMKFCFLLYNIFIFLCHSLIKIYYFNFSVFLEVARKKLRFKGLLWNFASSIKRMNELLSPPASPWNHQETLGFLITSRGGSRLIHLNSLNKKSKIWRWVAKISGNSSYEIIA